MEELINDLKEATKFTIGDVLDDVLSQVDTFDLCESTKLDEDIIDRATRGDDLTRTEIVLIKTQIIRYLNKLSY